MHLRKLISTPDRFDETVFKTKHKDSTRPQYPELLASQVIPFDPKNRPAVFPSLPLTTALRATLHQKEPATPPFKPTQRILKYPVSTADGYKEVETPNRSAESKKPNDTIRALSSVNGEPRKTDTCTICNGKSPIEWNTLSLSVQHHIFGSLLKQQKYAEVVATTIKLSYQELEAIQHQVNLRKIYNAPLETIWSYGAAASKLGAGVIDPEQINDLMDYLIFANQYEVVGEDEIASGKEFLKQFGIDTSIMDNVRNGDVKMQFVQAEKLRAPDNEIEPQYRRRSLNLDMQVDIAKANRIGKIKSEAITAPASIGSFGQTETGGSINDISTDNCESRRLSLLNPNPLPTCSSQSTSKLASKDIQLSIDDHGHASITNLGPQTCATGRPVAYRPDAATIEQLTSFPLQELVESKIHKKHNPKAFAAHLNRVTFPASKRHRLVEQDPETMNCLDHWLVYGCSWRYTEHLIADGPVFKPRIANYEPRKTLLDKRSSQSLVIRALVELHNNWVCTGLWTPAEGSNGMDVTREFDLMAETVMEDALGNQIIHEDPVTANDAKSVVGTMCPADSRTCLSVDRKDFSHSSDSTLIPSAEKDIRTSTAINSCTNSVSSVRTPSNQKPREHTGDTTIDILGSKDVYDPSLGKHPVVEFAHQKLHSRGVFGTYGGKNVAGCCYQLPSKAISNVNSNVLSDKPESLSMKAPSYSPISDQDSESLPAWARSKNANTSKKRNDFSLSLNRRPGTSIQGNTFLEGIIAAAAEDVQYSPEISSPESTASQAHETDLANAKRQLRPNAEVHIRSQAHNSDQKNSQHKQVLEDGITVARTKPNPSPIELTENIPDHENELYCGHDIGLKRGDDSHLPILPKFRTNVPDCSIANKMRDGSDKGTTSTDDQVILRPKQREFDSHNLEADGQLITLQPNSVAGGISISENQNFTKANNKSKSRAAPLDCSKNIPSPKSSLKKTTKTPSTSASQIKNALSQSTSNAKSPKQARSKASDTSPPTHPSAKQSKTTSSKETPSAPTTRQAAATSSLADNNPGTKKRRKDFGVKRGSYKKRTPTVHVTTPASSAVAEGGDGAQPRNLKRKRKAPSPA